MNTKKLPRAQRKAKKRQARAEHKKLFASLTPKVRGEWSRSEEQSLKKFAKEKGII